MNLLQRTSRQLMLSLGALALGAGQTALALDLEPLPVTADSTPFFGAFADLSAAGFTEDEYQVSGTADVYEYTPDLQVAVQTADVPYTSRLMIRRPAAAEDFNGTVVFEMLNPTAGHDIDFMWHYIEPLVLADGYIWVGVTIRPLAIDQLKGWDPQRYGALSMPDRGVTYDMYRDLAALFRDASDPENPLAGYDITHIIGSGYSQSDDWMTTFSNEFHTTDFDGYLTGGGNAAARAINSSDTEFYPDERRFNTVDAPYFRVQSETEVAYFTYPAEEVRQPDSSVFRQWEVPGAAHGSGIVWQLASQVRARDLGGPFPPCNLPLAEIGLETTVRAALDHMNTWVRDGVAPPASLWIETQGLRNVVRDTFGNALGGVRLPQLEVPFANYFALNQGIPPCVFAGAQFVFDDATLESLYRNHGKYVSQFAHAANALEQQGYMLPADAEAVKDTAGDSNIGK